MNEITKDELEEAMKNIFHDKNLRLDDWLIEFYIQMYERIGNDLLAMVEESKIKGNILVSFNSTFLTLTPKKDNVDGMDDL